MRIGEAAAAAGLTPRALRYYEQEGLFGTRRTPSGHREYGPEEVGRVRLLRELLDAGLTVADVRAFVHGLDAGDLEAGDPDPERLDAGDPEGCERVDDEVVAGCPLAVVTERRLADLDRRIEQLTALRARLSAAFDHRFSEQFANAPLSGAASTREPRGRATGRGRPAQSTPLIRPTRTAPSRPTAAEKR